MKEIKEKLIKQQEELEKLIISITAAANEAPEGSLRIVNSNGRIQYYHITPNSKQISKTGQYIKNENVKLAYELAQKAYDANILDIAKRNLAQINKFLQHYHFDRIEKAYSNLNLYRKRIVKPRFVSNEEFANEWKSVKYKGKEFADGMAEIYTNNGERVRSKSEKIIADQLLRAGIPYRYEHPIMLHGIGQVYPDFTILNVRELKEFYWEHMGMMDNKEYCEYALNKIDLYIKNNLLPGDKLVLTHETSKRPLETIVIDNLIKSKFL